MNYDILSEDFNIVFKYIKTLSVVACFFSRIPISTNALRMPFAVAGVISNLSLTKKSEI